MIPDNEFIVSYKLVNQLCYFQWFIFAIPKSQGIASSITTTETGKIGSYENYHVMPLEFRPWLHATPFRPEPDRFQYIL